MKTLTICGSMRFEKLMQKVAYTLETEQGFNVLQCIYSNGEMSLSKEQLERLVSAHYRKIDLSDGIYVVNPGGYIGESVRAEIEYAMSKGKEILYYEEWQSVLVR